jgi:hypothetical protein
LKSGPFHGQGWNEMLEWSKIWPRWSDVVGCLELRSRLEWPCGLIHHLDIFGVNLWSDPKCGYSGMNAQSAPKCGYVWIMDFPKRWSCWERMCGLLQTEVAAIETAPNWSCTFVAHIRSDRNGGHVYIMRGAHLWCDPKCSQAGVSWWIDKHGGHV